MRPPSPAHTNPVPSQVRPQRDTVHYVRPHAFDYVAPLTTAGAATALAEAGAAPLGGGTDLLSWIGEGLAAPETLVDLRRVSGSRDITVERDGVAIGASARLSEVSAHPEIRARFPALAHACESVGTPALRAMGTLGGNLCQRPRCWYLRRGVPCLKNGGSTCPAASGENQYHAILGGGPCFIVHPSDPAVALTALDAEVEIRGRGSSRSVSIGDFFVLPSERIDHETILGDGEYVSAIRIPASAASTSQRYDKLMQRGAWDFAVVSLAFARRTDGEVRLVLGGVAPKPWRVTSSVEEDVASGGLDLDAAETLADRALVDAQPLTKNGYKLRMARTLLIRAILELGG